MQKVRILELARFQSGYPRDPNRVIPEMGRSIAIVCNKVSTVLSGTRLTTQSDGGEDDYCTVVMDNGQEYLVCGQADMVMGWLELVTD